MTANMLYLCVEEMPERFSRGLPWSRKLALAKYNVLIKDDFKCVSCGRDNKLTIDHKYKFIGDRRNADDYPIEDCQTLCIYCHLKKNGDIK